MKTSTRKFFDTLYEWTSGYNFFEYEDCILFDFVTSNNEIQTIKYIKKDDVVKCIE